MIRLNQTLRFAMEFSWFCKNYNIMPHELAQMIAHAERSVKAYERNDGKAHRDNQYSVESLAKMNGLEVDWPGLWPCVQIAGKPETNRTLPSAP